MAAPPFRLEKPSVICTPLSREDFGPNSMLVPAAVSHSSTTASGNCTLAYQSRCTRGGYFLSRISDESASKNSARNLSPLGYTTWIRRPWGGQTTLSTAGDTLQKLRSICARD